ncbi:hypothetical protein ACQY0O_001587 [Thecaphora frezii]
MSTAPEPAGLRSAARQRRGEAPTAAAFPSSASTTASRLSVLLPAANPGSTAGSRLALPKSASTAAIVTSDGTEGISNPAAGFRADPQQRPAATSGKGKSTAKRVQSVVSASESLRRVASSSILVHPAGVASQTNREARSAQGQPDRLGSAAPYVRNRRDSQTSVASGASGHSALGAGSSRSSSFRNPAHLLLQQRPASVYGLSTAPDRVNVSGKAVDNRSHLTALGHASQVRDQSTAASTKPARKRSVQKATTLSATPPDGNTTSTAGALVVPAPPQRSRTIGVAAAPRNGSHDRSVGGSPSSGPSNATARRPKHSPPTVPSPATVNQEDDDGMSKRRHEQVEPLSDASNLETTLGSVEITDSNATIRPRKATSASRRKTWFGLGRGGPPSPDAASDEPTKADAIPSYPAGSKRSGNAKAGQQRGQGEPRNGAGTRGVIDEPPPPMDEAEAAFRASLGLPMGGTCSSTVQNRDRTLRPKRIAKEASDGGDWRRPGGDGKPQDVDPQSTVRPARNRNGEASVRAARRITWFGWGASDVVGDDGGGASDGKDDAAAATAVKPSTCEAASDEAMREPSAVEASPAVDASKFTSINEPAAETVDAVQRDPASGPGQIAVRIVRKRGWLGRAYEVQEVIREQAAAAACDFNAKDAAAAEGPADRGTDRKGEGPGPLADTADEAKGSPWVPDQASAPAYPPLQDELRPQPSFLSLRGLWNRGGKLPDAVEVVPSRPSQPDPPPPEPSSGPSATTEGTAEPTEAGPVEEAALSAADWPASSSGTWIWSLWRGRGPTNEQSTGDGRVASSEAVDPAPISAVAGQGPEHDRDPTSEGQPATADEAAAAEAPQTHGPGASSFQDSTGSWTYSSYLASWVPMWIYNAQEGVDTAEGEATWPEGSDYAPSEPPRTPAEQVKADALARPDPSLPSPIVDPGRAILNDATRQGWVSYFSSRSANRAKPIEAPPTDADGLEIMDISDMPPDRPGPAPSRAVPAKAARAAERSNGRQQAKDGGKGADAESGPSTPASRSIAAFAAKPNSKPASIANSDAGRPSTPLSTSRDSANTLGKAALAKASNASAALALGVGSTKKTNTSATTAAAAAPPSSSDGAVQQKHNAARAAPPNLVLPSFEDTFNRPPRIWAPKVGVLERTLSVVNSYLFSKMPDLERMKRPTRFSSYAELADASPSQRSQRSQVGRNASGQHLAGKAKVTGIGSSREKGKEEALKEIAALAQPLPRAWPTLGQQERAQTRGTAGIGKIVVIGVHGWFTQSIFKTVIGEPTGTSLKFATMQADSIQRHFAEAGLELNPEAITVISLQGDGKVADRVDRLFSELLNRPHWVKDLAEADAIMVSAHSQGAVVATQLLARLIEQRQVLPERSRICLLAMCGIHHGPFAHLRSTITSSYINYFETAAAKELFDFQSSQSPASAQYTASLKIILDAGVKAVYVGSADDNVVPLYSALNSSNAHPSILRALYIDGQAFPKVDFLTNLLVLCVAVKNAGLSDHNLLTLLSASVAGSLYGGTGHSKVYEEKAVYDLATRYLFEVSHPLSEPTRVPGPAALVGASSLSSSAGAGASSSMANAEADADSKRRPQLVSDHFEAQRWNPYELPWALRGLFEDRQVRTLFAEDILGLLEDYDAWRPDAKNKTLKDLQWRLAPMRSIVRPHVEQAAGEEETQPSGDQGGRDDKRTGNGVAGGKPGSSKL